MSKSYNNDIKVFETQKNLKKKVMSITTDTKTLEDIKDSDTCNIFALIKLF
jgi:tryptophanyl-tRNA synthetase